MAAPNPRPIPAAVTPPVPPGPPDPGAHQAGGAVPVGNRTPAARGGPTGVLDPAVASRLKRDPAGLVAAVVQQFDTGEVLMVGWMDDEALRRTLTTGLATYFSRSRQRYWTKGETSGHYQRVRSVDLDCDGDALLVRVDQIGPACHTGTRTCFSERITYPPGGTATITAKPDGAAPDAGARS